MEFSSEEKMVLRRALSGYAQRCRDRACACAQKSSKAPPEAVGQAFAEEDRANALHKRFVADTELDPIPGYKAVRAELTLATNSSSADDAMKCASPLAKFIRKPSGHRKKIYIKVLKRASESQNEVIERAAKKRSRSENDTMMKYQRRSVGVIWDEWETQSGSQKGQYRLGYAETGYAAYRQYCALRNHGDFCTCSQSETLAGRRMIINGGEKWVPLAELNEAMTNEGAKDCRIDDLGKALFKYGQHTGGCPAWGRPRPDLCTCGYIAAFRGNYPRTFYLETPLTQNPVR